MIKNSKTKYSEQNFRIFIDKFSEESNSINNIKNKNFFDKKNDNGIKLKMKKKINEDKQNITENDNDNNIKNITHTKKKKRNKKDWELCIGCNNYNVIVECGSLICTNCGLNNGAVLSDGQEWRFYGQYDNKGSNPARCDFPTNELLPNVSMGSLIKDGWKSANMKRVNNSLKWNSITYKDSSILKSFINISNVCNQNNIDNSIAEEAKRIYKIVKDEKMYKKSKKTASEAACLKKALANRNFRRNNIEMARMFSISIDDMRKAWKELQSLISINYDINGKLDDKLDDEIEDSDDSDYSDDENITDANLGDNIVDNFDNISNIIFEEEMNNTLSLLHRNCSELNLSDELYTVFENVYKYVIRSNILVHHTPMSCMASIIYYCTQSLNINISTKKIIGLCGVSDITINKCVKKLDNFKSDIINNTLLKKFI